MASVVYVDVQVSRNTLRYVIFLIQTLLDHFIRLSVIA